ncbi:hypothetical protein KOR42_55840 [Thalassoglobus neptunius]|uniref:Uncharacterized protein n=1 Tax=Thalassoglobus neptunius TaxID=1938619 RepID=A0A5C5UTZ5_9PLAN|nr:hypothetical protein KOR42_55840 [Thalassoglobus neptunius]
MLFSEKDEFRETFKFYCLNHALTPAIQIWGSLG